MEENLSKTLNLSENVSSIEDNMRDEKILKKAANAILIVGIISTLILFFSITLFTVKGLDSLDSKTVFSGSGLVITAGTLFSSIATWAFLRVVSNIATSLKILVQKSNVE